jgi:hypothetical protein
MAKVKVIFPKVKTYIKQLRLEPKDTVQKLIDIEIVRLSVPYVPQDTGATEKSVFPNTDFGSGKIVYGIYGYSPGRNTWNDTTSKFQDRPPAGKRGPFWALRMWNDGGKEKVMLAVKRFMGK